MTSIALWAARMLGGVLIYAALFLYEDEEGKIQNRVEEWWIRVRYTRDRAISGSVAFVRGLARLVGRALDNLLGKKLVSLRVAGVSYCFTFASIHLFGIIAPFIKGPHRAPFQASNIGFFLLFMCLGIFPALVNGSTAYMAFWTAMLVFAYVKFVGFFLSLIYAAFGLTSTVRFVSFVGFFLGWSFVSDVLFIALTRWILRRITSIDKIYTVLVLLAADFGFLVILVLAPVEIGVNFLPLWPLLGLLIMCCFVLNSVDILFCLVSLLILFLLAVHRLLWPLLERPLYAFARHGMIRKKKLLWTFGLALIFIHPLTSADFWNRLLDKIGG